LSLVTVAMSHISVRRGPTPDISAAPDDQSMGAEDGAAGNPDGGAYSHAPPALVTAAGPNAATSGALGAKPVVRGIYAAEDEADPEFRQVVTFDTAEECKAWYSSRVRCTNPTYPQCTQLYTTACDWAQVNDLLLKPLAEYRRRAPVRAPQPLDERNVFLREPGILASLRSRLELPFHARVDEDSTLNTLRYLFFHMRCGIFVLIRANALAMFVPFVNKDYTNTWSASLTVEEPVFAEYVRDKAQLIQEDYIQDKTR
jgi:hypothetical protein